MRSSRVFLMFVFILNLIPIYCKKSPEQNIAQFNKKFFEKYVPEFPDAQLMTKANIPQQHQEFYDEAKGKLQLLFDVNRNDIPEYIICGFSNTMLQQGEKGPYFIAIFEQTESGIKRLYLHKLLVPPVSLAVSKNKIRKGILILFSFFSDFAAEIYFENNEYHVEKLF